MNIKKLTKAVSSVLLLSAAVFCGCQRDNDGLLILVSESFTGGEKLAVNGTHSTWVDGDMVQINSGEYEVAVNASNEASISGVPGADAFYAVYPASLCGNLTSTSATLDLPDTYQYRTDGSGKQILELPMVGYLDPNESSGPLYMKHATGALVLRIENKQEEIMYIDTVFIISNNFQISGSRTVDVSNPNTITAVSTSVAAEKCVKMLFERQNVVLAQDAYVDVMLPVLPVGDGNRFTIKVVGHTRLNRYTFTRQQLQSHGGALSRSQIGYASGIEMRSSGYVTITSVLDKDGTVFLIKNVSDYLFLVEACKNNWVNSGSSYRNKDYRLENTIDMSGYVTEPLINFNGSFNGNGKEIRNLTIESDYEINGSGRIGMISHSTSTTAVSNLTLRNVSLKYTGSNNLVYMGGLIGYYATSATVSACRVLGLTANVSNNGPTVYIAGLMGATTNVTTFNNCEASNIVWAPGAGSQRSLKLRYGGLVGNATDNINFESCKYSASMDSTLYSWSTGVTCWGGLVACSSGNIVAIGCETVQSKVSYLRASSKYAGGIVGWCTGSPTINLTNTNISGSVDIYGGNSNTSYGAVAGNGTPASVIGPASSTITFTVH